MTRLQTVENINRKIDFNVNTLKSIQEDEELKWASSNDTSYEVNSLTNEKYVNDEEYEFEEIEWTKSLPVYSSYNIQFEGEQQFDSFMELYNDSIRYTQSYIPQIQSSTSVEITERSIPQVQSHQVNKDWVSEVKVCEKENSVQKKII